MAELHVTRYSDKSLHVTGDRSTYDHEIKQFGGTYRSNLKGGAGWLVPVANAEAFCAHFNLENPLNAPAERPRPRVAASRPAPQPVEEVPEEDVIDEYTPPQRPAPVQRVARAAPVQQKAPVQRVAVPVRVSSHKDLPQEEQPEDYRSLARSMRALSERLDRLENGGH